MSETITKSSNHQITKCVIDNKIPFIEGALEPFAEVVYLPGAEISADDVKDADALIVRTRTKCNAALLDGSNIKFIATATIGFDHIDAEYCEKNNITWTSAPGCNSFSVQQYIASTLLNIANDEGFCLKDKTLGIVGVGNVGSKVAKFAESIGMRVLLNDPPRAKEESENRRIGESERGEKIKHRTSNEENPESIDLMPNALCLVPDTNFVSLEKVKEESDFITFHVPLNREGEYKTYHMVDEAFLCEVYPSSGVVRNSTWIINSSRGEVVDNAALKRALIKRDATHSTSSGQAGDGCTTGGVAGAVLDVWENEPNIDLELMELAEFATPHIAGYSADGKANGTSMSVQALSRVFGLGIDDWRPETVPVPENNVVTVDCEGKSLEEVMRIAILATYDIREDDGRLRNSPKTFEKQRGDYPLRREPVAYKIDLQNDSANFKERLKELRFT